MSKVIECCNLLFDLIVALFWDSSMLYLRITHDLMSPTTKLDILIIFKGKSCHIMKLAKHRHGWASFERCSLLKSTRWCIIACYWFWCLIFVFVLINVILVWDDPKLLDGSGEVFRPNRVVGASTFGNANFKPHQSLCPLFTPRTSYKVTEIIGAQQFYQNQLLELKSKLLEIIRLTTLKKFHMDIIRSKAT